MPVSVARERVEGLGSCFGIDRWGEKVTVAVLLGGSRIVVARSERGKFYRIAVVR